MEEKLEKQMKSEVSIAVKNNRVDYIGFNGDCFQGKIICGIGNPLDSLPPRIAVMLVNTLIGYVVDSLCKMVNHATEVGKGYGFGSPDTTERWAATQVEPGQSMDEAHRKLMKELGEDPDEQDNLVPSKDEIIH